MEKLNGGFSVKMSMANHPHLPSGSYHQVPGTGPEFLTSAADSLVLRLPSRVSEYHSLLTEAEKLQGRARTTERIPLVLKGRLSPGFWALPSQCSYHLSHTRTLNPQPTVTC